MKIAKTVMAVVSPWRETNRQLKRLADCAEIFLLQQYGYAVVPPVTDTSGPEPTVEYSTDEDTLRRELKKAAGLEPEDEE